MWINPPLKTVPNKTTIYSCLSDVCKKTTVPRPFRKLVELHICDLVYALIGTNGRATDRVEKL